MKTSDDKPVCQPGGSGTATTSGGKAFDEYLARRRIPNLDGLRGLAVLLVLFHHVPSTELSWVAQFQHHSKHGVSLFFVISGYIVMTLMLREVRRDGAVDIPSFLWRRALRLWPLYYVILFGEALLVFGFGVYSPENRALFEDKLLCYVLYCSNWLETSGQGPFFVSWSLAVEEQFYLLLSLLFLLLRPAWVVAAVGILLILKTILIAGPGGVDPSLMPWRVLLSYSEPILLGVLLASAMNCRRLYPAFSVLARNRGTIAFMLGLVVAFMLWGELDDKSSAQSLVFYVICTLLVGVAAVSDKLPLLGGTAMSWIGLLSYGIYLMHMPVLSVIKKFTLNPAAVLVMTILAVLPAAWFSFRFFEEPIRRLGRAPRIVRKRARVVAQQARG